jgi:hypothetical protein
MTSILDIPIDDVKKFLQTNDISISKNVETMYDDAFKLMEDPNTSYYKVPRIIIEWMLAYNLMITKIDIPTYSISDIEKMNQKQINDLAKSLGMRSNNIKSIINILNYAGKLNTHELILNRISDNSLYFGVLPKDSIKDITEFLDYKSVSSLLSSSKLYNELSKDYKDKIFMVGVERELKYVNISKRPIINGNIIDSVYNFKVGDRVIANNKNYIITFMSNISISGDSHGSMKHVDILGNILDNEEISIKLSKRELFNTGIMKYEGFVIVNSKIAVNPGILLFDDGPEIKSINSIYLKYKVCPTNVTCNPTLNMLVLVLYTEELSSSEHEELYHYYINNITNNTLTLKHVPNFDTDYLNPPDILTATKMGNTWITDDEKWEIYSIGGF